MAAAETTLPSIGTLTTLGSFPDTQEDFLKVRPQGLGGWLGSQAVVTSYPGIQRPGQGWGSSAQSRGLHVF